MTKSREEMLYIYRCKKLDKNVLKFKLELDPNNEFTTKTREILEAMQKQAFNDGEYLQRLEQWIRFDVSTLALRELVAEVGYDYLGNDKRSRFQRNCINKIDSMQHKFFTNKLNELNLLQIEVEQL